MNYNSLYSWLARKSKTITNSIQSCYFNIDDLIIRYSNHFSKTSKCDICIIRLENGAYLVMLTSYAVPKYYTKVKEVKDFIETFLYINSIRKQGFSSPYQTRISELEELDRKELKELEKKKKESEKLALSNEVQSISIASLLGENLYNSLNKLLPEVKRAVLLYLMEYPRKADSVQGWVSTNWMSKHQKELWNKYIIKRVSNPKQFIL